MTNINKIYINDDGTPHVTHYNNSWNVILMETTDNNDYSLIIWETLYDNIEDDITETKRVGIIKSNLITFCESYDIDLVRVPEDKKVESLSVYYFYDLEETKVLLEHFWEEKPKPTLLESIKNLHTNPKSDNNMEDMLNLYDNHRVIFEKVFDEMYYEYKKISDKSLSKYKTDGSQKTYDINDFN